MSKKSIPLLFADDHFGTEEYGFIPRNLQPHRAEEAAEEEDYRYEQFLKAIGVNGRVEFGSVIIVKK